MNQSDKKTLYLLDGMALVYRAHFVFIRNPRITSKGLNTSAIFGFTNTLLQILNQPDLTHVAVAFDTMAPTFRHEEFKEYKAQREELPEDIATALPHIRELTEALGVPVLTLDGYEADDIIGTLTKRAEAEGFTTYMVTPDKDFGQLVSERSLLWRPGRQGDEAEIWDVQRVLDKWGIERVEQVIDILGLMGDSVDNIPGIPGIGEKTGIKLIGEYGSIENLLEHADELKGKMKEKVKDNAEQARLSKRLATIDIDSPIPQKPADLKRGDINKEKVEALFAEFEFQALGKRLFGEDFSAKPAARAKMGAHSEGEMVQGDLFGGSYAAGSPAAPAAAAAAEPGERTDLKRLADVEHDYRIADTKEKRADLLKQLSRQDSVCFDIESTGLDAKCANLVGIAFSWKAHTGWYVPFPADDAPSCRAILNEFRPLFESETIEKVGHNLKYDATVLAWNGMNLRGPLFDSMLAHFLIAPDMRHGMDYLSEIYLGYAPVPIEDLIGPKGKEQKNMKDVPLEVISEYATEDADVTWQLATLLRPKIPELGLERVFHEAECPLITVLVDMEREGIRVDTSALEEVSCILGADIEELHKRIHELAGVEFNVDSPKQLGEVLFDVLKLDDKAKKTKKTGQYATNEQVLQRLLGRHEIIERVLDYRACKKLKSTYVDTLPGNIDERTGKVHTTYNQAVAATGRLNSQDPNLQNIPIRTERGREIRKAFVPRDRDHLLLSADYSQIELRIMAEMSGDADMQKAFIANEDIHTTTAAKVNNVDPADVTREMRSDAKMVNFGVIYGISAFGLSQRLNIARTDAAKIIDQYFEKYPGVKRYMDDTINAARDNGYVTTMLGRRRYIRDINSRNNTLRGQAERNAINSPIQGTAADMIKIAMIRIHRELEKGGYKTKMLLQVHDELVFDLHREEEQEIRKLVEECMKTALPMTVPIVVEMGTGENWLDAH